MVMAINNAALLTQPTDISNLSSSFKDGQKLRQEYDARQHQKALNDIMRISGEDEIDTFAQQLAAARQHKYAGALVPAVQQYEEARQKAALDNLKTSADIRKTFGETGKLNAETGKIGAETEDAQLKTAQGIKDYVSAAAVTQDPKVFGLHIGELYKRGLITESQTQSLLSLIVKDPENAAKVMQAMAMGNPEIAKTFMPKVEYSNLGNRIEATEYNPMTREMTGLGGYEIGTSPDVIHQGQVSENNNIRTTNASMYGADRSAEASMYGADSRLQGTMYTTDTNAETKMFEINQKGEIDWFKADTDRIKATTGGGSGGASGKGLESDERKKLIEIEENNNSTKQAVASLKKMQALAGDDKTYSGFAASQRAAIMSNLGWGGSQADNTVLYDSLATGQALEQLRSVFGGNPTEGERKILLEIQASSNKTPAQKKAILNNAIKMAEARIANNNRTANRIRTGEYASTTDIGATQSRAGYRTDKNHGRKGTGNKPKVSPTVQKYADYHFGGR